MTTALSDAGDILEQTDVGVVATDASPLLTPGRFNLRPRHIDCQVHLCLHGVDSIRMGPKRAGCMDALLNGYSIADAEFRCRRTSRVKLTNAGSSVVATVRGRGKSTTISPTIRPRPRRHDKHAIREKNCFRNAVSDEQHSLSPLDPARAKG